MSHSLYALATMTTAHRFGTDCPRRCAFKRYMKIICSFRIIHRADKAMQNAWRNQIWLPTTAEDKRFPWNATGGIFGQVSVLCAGGARRSHRLFADWEAELDQRQRVRNTWVQRMFASATIMRSDVFFIWIYSRFWGKVIGGWANNRTLIRRRKQDLDLATEYTFNVLRKDDPLKVEIQITTGECEMICARLKSFNDPEMIRICRRRN